MRYRKRDEVVDAVRYNGNNFEEIKNWAESFPRDEDSHKPQLEKYADVLYFVGGSGAEAANPGDWVIYKLQTKSFACLANEVFEDLYEHES
jgi:hypothetical protein